MGRHLVDPLKLANTAEVLRHKSVNYFVAVQDVIHWIEFFIYLLRFSLNYCEYVLHVLLLLHLLVLQPIQLLHLAAVNHLCF